MAFQDYIDLRTAVVEHVRDSSISDVFPRLLLLAESEMNNRLRCRVQMQSTNLVIASKVAVLPVGFLEAIGLYDGQGCEFVEQPLQAVRFDQAYTFYAISGGSVVASRDGTFKLDYYEEIPTLTSSQTASNWVLAKHPALYLYAVGAEAAKYLHDMEMATATMALAEMEYAKVAARDQGDRYSRARVRFSAGVP